MRHLQVGAWLLGALLLWACTGATVYADEAAPEKTPVEVAQATGDAAKVKADTAWMLVSSAFVLLMVPGLALFYGGMVRSKNMLTTMMHSAAALSVVGVFWVVIGYSLAFGAPWIGAPAEGVANADWGGSYLGFSPELVFLSGVEATKPLPGYGYPIYLHVIFQGMFAILTPALISGAFAERVRFVPYCVFILLWVTLVYCPLAHSVWSLDFFTALPGAEGPTGASSTGFLGKMGALDFAGGTVVHIAAGFAGLAAAVVLKKRSGYPQHPIHPSGVVLTLIGAMFLWFGWFGFNAGSALGSSENAVAAFASTQAAAAGAGLTWMLSEYIHKGKATALGLASGFIAGLVAVTPAAGFVTMGAGLIIGLIAGVVCYLAVVAKTICGYDDSLDAFGVHGIGGLLGALLTGLFCTTTVGNILVTESNTGVLVGGNMDQFVIQAKAAGISVVYAFVVSAILLVIMDKVFGLTASKKEEVDGLDRSQHGEASFDFSSEGAVTMSSSEPRPAVVPPNGRNRFTLVVDGADATVLAKVWADLCQPGGIPDAEFSRIYPNLTTVSGNRFRFKTGDAKASAAALQSLLQKRLGKASIAVRVEA
ncbi:ammonium transporter [Tuwongella immobilis]|uniref:Ammonium transporter n=1 Tax=Tuwongella immobilis TaxID=692036 RepID=A0A6C2YJV1_9BACT|nr:ammonium transporter [Tuwongella immobilis]VIP01571.1 ammonium transporter : Ammonium transporter OS=Geobacter sp. (strain M21) GN=GM21_2708 PE=4 SV=1: Ammonium_transp [Tuwongella immobilis]VTR98804.1 ammonium transporter : Ammonium transporter OS=Geobacter sp. (strain M21) GN=GM21_2708 PE=4 SV=1: Ammonium_transp [Tuwongella immobilis]